MGLGGTTGGVGMINTAPVNFGAYKDTTTKPMLPGLGGTTPSNMGATSVAPPPIARPVQQSPQQQYTQNQGSDLSSLRSGLEGLSTSLSNFAASPEASTSQVPQEPKSDPYRDAITAYISSLTPTAEEKSAQDYLNRISTQNRLDYEKALNQGETLGYATGLAGQQARTAGIQEAGASGTLSALTGQRSAMTQAQKARLDYEQSLVPKPQEAYTLGAGEIRYDAKDNKIAEGGVKSLTLPASAQEFEYAKLQGYKGDYSQYQTEDANRKRSIVNINAAGLTPQMTSTALKLSDDYEQRSKDYYTVRDSFNRIESASQNPSAAGDMALLFSFMKILDPNSVVRETEYATAQNAGSIPERTRAAYNSAVNGQKLSEAQREDFVGRATSIFNTAKKQQDSIAKEFVQRSEQYGVPSNLVVRDTVATGAPTGTGTQDLTVLRSQYGY